MVKEIWVIIFLIETKKKCDDRSWKSFNHKNVFVERFKNKLLK